MSKSVRKPPPYEIHSRELRPPGFEPPVHGFRTLLLGLVVFWSIIIGGLALLHSCNAEAQGRMVFLEDEQDLGNGYKLCIYSEGVTITRPDYSLCPLSIEV